MPRSGSSCTPNSIPADGHSTLTAWSPSDLEQQPEMIVLLMDRHRLAVEINIVVRGRFRYPVFHKQLARIGIDIVYHGPVILAEPPPVAVVQETRPIRISQTVLRIEASLARHVPGGIVAVRYAARWGG